MTGRAPDRESRAERPTWAQMGQAVEGEVTPASAFLAALGAMREAIDAIHEGASDRPRQTEGRS